MNIDHAQSTTGGGEQGLAPPPTWPPEKYVKKVKNKYI